LVQFEQEVLFRAVDAFMNVRRQSEFLALRRSNVGVIGQELRAAQDRFEVGEVTRTDVALAEARRAAAQSQLAAAEGALVQANEEFRAAVGRAPGRLDVVSPAAVQQNIDEARAFAVRRHPNISGAQHGVSAAELNIRRAEAALNPRLNLSGTIGLTDTGDSTQRLGLTYGGTIYQGGQLQSVIRQAQARRDASRSTLLITSQGVNQNVGNAYAILRVARASNEASGLQVRAARTAFRGVREEATLGARTTLDVLNAEQELLDAQASMISAQADEVVASYRVLASMGLLTADHLNLGVQSYDPAAYYNLVREAPATYSQQGQALDRVLRSIGD
jgi:outer membrane protein